MSHDSPKPDRSVLGLVKKLATATSIRVIASLLATRITAAIEDIISSIF